MAKIKPLIIENKATKSAFNQPLSLEELSLRKDPNQIERGMCRIQFSCDISYTPDHPGVKEFIQGLNALMGNLSLQDIPKKKFNGKCCAKNFMFGGQCSFNAYFLKNGFPVCRKHLHSKSFEPFKEQSA